MDKKDFEKIEKLRKILESKIDQLLVLIGDNKKTLNYDFFSINKDNLDEQLLKIREKFQEDPNGELEILVMKKYIINLTKEFLNKDIFDEIKNEERKLKKIRYAYLIILSILVIIGLVVYTGYFSFILNNFSCEKQNNIQKCPTILQNNTQQVIKTSKHIDNGNNTNSTNNTTTPPKKVEKKYKKGNYLIGILDKKIKYKDNLLLAEIKIIKSINNKKIDITNIKKLENINKSDIFYLKYSGKLNIDKVKTFKGKFKIKGKIDDKIILGEVIKGNFIKKEYIEKNLIKEKTPECPYNKVLKLTLKETPLKIYPLDEAKNIKILEKGTKFKVLGCKKDNIDKHWWYKAKLKDKTIGWINTSTSGEY